MPKTCETCRYYSAADAETTCPACGTALRFTLLPPPDAPDTSPAATAAVPRGGAPGGLGALWELLINSPIGLVGLMVLGLAATFVIHDWATRDPGPGKEVSSRIKIGMHFSEVGRILDVEPAPKPSYP